MADPEELFYDIAHQYATYDKYRNVVVPIGCPILADESTSFKDGEKLIIVRLSELEKKLNEQKVK